MVTYIAPPMNVVTVQPVVGNPFYGFNDDWRVEFFDCCNDVSQCKVDHSLPSLFLICVSRVGCYAHWCGYCFLNSLAAKIDEPTSWCVPNRVAVYRMKIRSVLRIRVSILTRNTNIPHIFLLHIRVAHSMTTVQLYGVHCVSRYKWTVSLPAAVLLE
jgi:hypothetical protein